MAEVITGSILEFKIPLDLGYGYCKINDFRSIREFDGILVKVFDCIEKTPIKNVRVLRDKDWLFGARRMPWIPNTRGKGAWKMKGVIISEDDAVIPDFKYSSKALELNPEEDHSKIETIWFAVKNISKSTSPCSYEQVRHLEDTVLSSQSCIEIRTAMEYCRANNLDVGQYFDLDDFGYKNIFRQMINVPVYSSIPESIRDKALC